MTSEQLAYIALNLLEGVGPVKVKALLDAFGSPQAALEADAAALQQVPGFGRKLAEQMARQVSEIDPDDEVRRAKALGARIITQADDVYPDVLRPLYDPPLVLYVLGDLMPGDLHAIAMVGSRRCSHYGKMVADRFAFQLAKVGYTVVSGLARGIDTGAHQGALKGGGRTLAVLGSGLEQLYPAENRQLAEKIAKQGAVLSEYPMGRAPDRTTFPYRNRIVSGLSKGVLLVEAAMGSGAMITCEMALQQGRSVFAVPGRIDQPTSSGCHRLIQQGACLVQDVDDILREFEELIPSGVLQQMEKATRRPDVQLSPAEAGIVRLLADGEKDVDELVRQSGIPVAGMSAVLLGLEMKRVIHSLPGRRFGLAVSLADMDLDSLH